ncbi:hypothetical protein [Amniculibacterium sp. G2-70]|nr:hypothetical protein [Amniculibacterium sp. G2-70]
MNFKRQNGSFISLKDIYKISTDHSGINIIAIKKIHWQHFC